MPPLTYIANPYSMHVTIWLEALETCGLQVRMETAERRGGGSTPDVAIDHLTPSWVRGPAIVRYLWAGVAARLRRRQSGEILHAHCSSGNGMVAWMSGRPYIVTTYGSEVLAAADRGRMYQWLIRRVLQGADRITATSPQMVDVLTGDYGIPEERIQLFDLGLDTTTFQPATDVVRRQLRTERNIAAEEPVWVAVKRAVPMNRTLELAQAFLQYCESHPQGKLVLLCGNADPDYVSELKQQRDGSSHGTRIQLIEDWLDASAVAEWSRLSDFAISVPTWDQMSNAVLEAMACGAIPILSEIGGYRSLRERNAKVHWIAECTTDTLVEAFIRSAAMPIDQRHREQQLGIDFIHEHYANRRVWEVLQRLYNLPAADAPTERKAA